jgi:hypothetical protein
MLTFSVSFLCSCDSLTAPTIQDPGLNLTAVVLTVQAKSTSTSTPTLGASISGEQTDIPSSEETRTPCNLARFIDDVTIPDGTEVMPGERFIKTWRLQNDGSCVWNPGYDLVHESGETMGAPEEQPLLDTTLPPGGRIDVSIELTAPENPGIYTVSWRLRSHTGDYFALQWNEPIYTQIIVIPGPTSTPSPTPTEVLPTSTPGPKPDVVIAGFSLEPLSPVAGSAVKIIVLSINQGDALAENFQVSWWAQEHEPTPACTWEIPSLAIGSSYIMTCEYSGYSRAGSNIKTVVVGDALNTLLESDESNNVAAITIQVLEP